MFVPSFLVLSLLLFFHPPRVARLFCARPIKMPALVGCHDPPDIIALKLRSSKDPRGPLLGFGL